MSNGNYSRRGQAEDTAICITIIILFAVAIGWAAGRYTLAHVEGMDHGPNPYEHVDGEVGE